MKGPIPQYVVAEKVLDASTLYTAQSLNGEDRKATNGTDVAAACCEVTLALSAGDFRLANLDVCFAALEADGLLQQHGQFSACTSLFDAASEAMRKVLNSEQDLRMAAMALSTFFSPFAPTVFAIAPHLLFGDTQMSHDNKGNLYRARIRVARKGPFQSCLLLEWNHGKQEGLMIGGERFLESLLQIAELWRGAAEATQKAHLGILAKTA